MIPSLISLLLVALVLVVVYIAIGNFIHGGALQIIGLIFALILLLLALQKFGFVQL